MMKAKKIYITVFLLLFALYSIHLESVLAADILDGLLPVSKEKEKRVGASVAKQVAKQFDEVDDPLVQERFKKIGEKLAKVSERPELIYYFTVLKAKEGKKENYYNAFALPGGYVYMFDAMMKKLETDDLIAAVIAHELAHIAAKHAINRMQSSLGINALMLLAIATGQDGRTVAAASEGLAQLMMSYSREDELEADKLSVKYMKEAGFDPEGVLDSLTMLRRLRKEGPVRKYMYYRSHPYLSERIAAVRSEIQGYTDFDSYINIPEKKDVF